MRVLRFFSLLFSALSAGMVLAHVLQMRTKMRMNPDEYSNTKALDETWSMAGALLDSGALLFSLPLLLFGRRTGQDRKATLAGIAALSAADALWASNRPVNDQVGTWESGEDVPQDWDAERKHWEVSTAARAVLQVGALGALIIASQRQPEPTLRDVINPQAKRLHKKASKLAPKATSRVEDVIDQLQPVAQHFLHEAGKHAPSSTDDARDKVGNLVEHAQPAFMRFLHDASKKSPVSPEDARDAADKAIHRARKPARRWMHRMPMLKAS